MGLHICKFTSEKSRNSFYCKCFCHINELTSSILAPSRHQPRPRFDRYRIASRRNAGRITPGLTGADVEFPAVPGAANDLARTRIAVAAGLCRFHQPGLLAMEQTSAAVWAAIIERVEL